MPAYYNEIDRGAAAWLRELIRAGLIADGEVDERSIEDVKPEDLDGFTQCHFFAGIGGWSYALRLAGVPDDWRCWTGSCPCQPFSVAGKGEGTSDERHLWPAFRWLIAQCRPSTIFGEQVASAAGREWLAGVRIDLEGMGYACGAADLCAASIGSPHIRQRLWWVANGGGKGLQRHSGDERDGYEPGRERAEPTGSTAACGRVDYTRTVWWPCRDGKARRVPARWVEDADRGRDSQPGLQHTDISSKSGADGGVAHTQGERDGGATGTTRKEKCGSGGALHGQLGGTDADGGVAKPEGQRLQESGEESRRSLEAPSADGGLPDTADGRAGRASEAEQSQDWTDNGILGSGSGGSICGLPDSAVERLEGATRAGIQGGGDGFAGDGPGRVQDSRHDGLEAEPGVQRVADGIPESVDGGRIACDAELFPLAEGVKGRVGLLKGYGNAINQQVAAIFIEAALSIHSEAETKEDK